MPSFEFEDQYKGVVAGIDEAGRGPWAGPVVAGAVVFSDRNVDEFLLKNLDDSKKLSAKKREELYEKLIDANKKGQIFIGIGEASVEEIDELNILQATFLAMKRAKEALGTDIDFAIVDGNQKPKGIGCDCASLVKGDAKSYSISAASILAKVSRDRLMLEYDKKYPQYAFAKHKGYGTKVHIEALKKYGKCEIHRESFIKNFVG